MLKRAWILPLLMLIAIGFAALMPARAAADDEFRRKPLNVYKDLPGVVPEEERVARDSYSCTTSIEDVYVGRGRYDILYGDVAPRRVYRCESESGLTYSGTRPPNTHWVPGLNPLHLPE
ncbi:exported protein of unknown function [Pseudorhizobium banfieldiae]|uniref:Uncharacterized protein n=1 Tax=Pseudorhizobium banfieldiae TaxID=1125847 RepID=L0NLY0_9HYPH|nr:hypothetical protein [Pseudorhizobium banfieldiae]CAD6596481.1 hypothetical protein RNT25_00305 [arsenite-oxidising bacterium NT-25]CAD6602814.1 hypothetical protein RTCK_01210 [Rhizobium sp. TCK]CCF21914.1 exported protein of unknown function [Pseudorhizobium banfieldiae]